MAASAITEGTASEVEHKVAFYEPPTLDELGGVVELTRGTAADDTADMTTAKYW